MQERVKGEAVKPNALLRLMKEIGPTRTSRQLGVSTTTLYKARKYNSVSKSIELAASAKLSQPAIAASAHVADKAVEEGRRMFIVDVPATKADLLKRVITQFGGEVEEN